MKLSTLPDKILIKETVALVNKEREILSEVLLNLQEIDRRKLFSEYKCGSLFEYCVKHLKYSEAQASRRVSAVRLLNKSPEIKDKVKQGDLNLSHLNDAQKFFKEEKITSSLERAEIFKLLENQSIRDGRKKLDELRKNPPPKEVSITISEETHSQLKRIHSWRSRSTLDQVIKEMAVEIEKVWDPELVKRKRTEVAGLSRYVSVQDRAQAWAKSQGKCTNCGSLRYLEIDHIKPFGVGGKSKAENLRLLCHNCNQRARFVFYGDKRAPFGAQKPT